MTIRRTRFEDLDAVAEVVIAAWRFAYSSFLPPEFMDQFCDPERRAGRMKETWSEQPLYFVAVDDDDKVIGFVRESLPPYDGFDAEIGALYVRPEAARAGVGIGLVKKIASEFERRGSMTLAIHTLADNSIGCAFYSKLGGRRYAETEWHGFPSVWFAWDDLTILTKK